MKVNLGEAVVLDYYYLKLEMFSVLPCANGTVFVKGTETA